MPFLLITIRKIKRFNINWFYCVIWLDIFIKSTYNDNKLYKGEENGKYKIKIIHKPNVCCLLYFCYCTFHRWM